MDASPIAGVLAVHPARDQVGQHLHPDLGVGRDVERGLHVGFAAPAVGAHRDRPRPRDGSGPHPRDPGIRLLHEPNRGAMGEDGLADGLEQLLQRFGRFDRARSARGVPAAPLGLGLVAGGESLRERAVDFGLHGLPPPDRWPKRPSRASSPGGRRAPGRTPRGRSMTGHSARMILPARRSVPVTLRTADSRPRAAGASAFPTGALCVARLCLGPTRPVRSHRTTPSRGMPCGEKCKHFSW